MDLASVGECALIPLRSRPDMSLFLYASTTKTFRGLSPHHYLELLSWITAPAAVSAAAVSRFDVLPTTGDTKFQPAPGPAQPSNLQRVSVSKADAIVQKVKDLPPLPSLVTKALSMLADPSTDLEAVAAVIGKDQALVAKLIKVSNSVLYGRVQKVGTLKQALTRLGSKIVKSLILSASTRGYFLKNSSGMGAWGQLLWQHTVECGLAARRVANAFAEQDPEDAFIGGILHDIGKLAILLIHPEKYKAIQKTVRSGNVSDIQAEINILGCSHEEIGYLLLDQWRMPDTAKVCARFHHSLEKAGEFKKLASIVAYGNYFSRTYGAHPQAVFQANGEPLTDPTHLLEIAEDMQTAIREDILADFASADFFT